MLPVRRAWSCACRSASAASVNDSGRRTTPGVATSYRVGRFFIGQSPGGYEIRVSGESQASAGSAVVADQTVVADVQVTSAVGVGGLGEAPADVGGPAAVPEAGAVAVARQPEVAPGAGEVGRDVLGVRLLELAAVLRHVGQGVRVEVVRGVEVVQRLAGV